MHSTTRAALNLAFGATDYDGALSLAAALVSGACQFTLRDLEKSDSAFVLFLRQQHPATYDLLHERQYGVKPKGAVASTNSAAAQQAKVKLAALGADVTLRDLEKSDPALVLALKHHAPEDYQRLFAATYGGGLSVNPTNTVTATRVPLASPATSGSTYRDKNPATLSMTEPDPEVLAQLPKLGELATNPRFERLD
jgi:hypothetical protein